MQYNVKKTMYIYIKYVINELFNKLHSSWNYDRCLISSVPQIDCTCLSLTENGVQYIEKREYLEIVNN